MKEAQSMADLRLPLLLAALSCGIGACDAGGRARTSGVNPGPTGPALEVDFALRKDLDLGSGFVGDVLQRDLDGDGFTDLVETNFLPMEVTIALGRPDGTFEPVTVRSTVGHGWRLASGDFDGDLDLDLAVAGHEYKGTGLSALEVFLQGPAAGEFTAPVLTLLSGVDPTDVAVAPQTGLAGAGGPDEIFAALRAQARVARYSVIGGALVETGSLASGNLGAAGGPFSLCLVDLGDDGWLDLVVGEEDVPGLSDRIVEYPRTSASFEPAALVFTPAFRPIVDAAGDVDDNGFDDVAVAQLAGLDALLLTADAGGLTGVVTLDFGGPTSSVLFPDLDLDGFADAIGTELLGSTVQVRRGLAQLSFDDPVYYNVGPVPRAIDTLLVPGDALPDLLCGNAKDLSLLMGLGDAKFRAARGFPIAMGGSDALESGDLDNDGDLDMVIISRNQLSVSFLEGFGDGTFVERVVLPLVPNPEDEPGHLVFADMDQDGDLDVVVSVAASDEVRLYRNPGMVEAFASPPPPDVTEVGGEPMGVAVADFDGDSIPDVAVCNELDGTLELLKNDGTGALTSISTTVLGFLPTGILCMDFDGDTAIDLAVLGENPAGHLVAILQGSGTGTFDLRQSLPLDGPSDSMASGDIDENDLPDLVIGQTDSTQDEVMVLRNQGLFAFSAQRLAVSDGPAAVALADVDRDQHLDLIVGSTPGELTIAFGNGAGSFPSFLPPAPGGLPLPHETLALRYADANGDELPDLLVVSPYTPFVWVGTNVSVVILP
jgi:hypothetical protein